MATRIMIAGAIASHPLGGAGNAWAFLQYVLGFRALGFETYYVEHIEAARHDDDWKPARAQSANGRFFRHVMEQLDLLTIAAGNGWRVRRPAACRCRTPGFDTPLLVNSSGHFRSPPFSRRVSALSRSRPRFPASWRQRYGIDMNFRARPITVGLTWVRPMSMPTCGIPWQTTLPPVALDSGYRRRAGLSVHHGRRLAGIQSRGGDGVWYGQKTDEFVRILRYPPGVRTAQLCSDRPDEPDYTAGKTAAAGRPAALPHPTRTGVRRGSRGEFTVVKHGYAAGRTGWFSDRSACCRLPDGR
jgi:hypothetical protein